MSFNYAFAFTINRRDFGPPPPAPALVPAPVPALVPAPVPALVPAPITRSNRFSLNRLIHVKASGGCRSCN